MIIACALRWGVASVRVYSTRRDSLFMGKHFRFREYIGGRRSFETAIVTKAGLWLYKNTFVNFMCKLVLPCVLLCKSIVIKPIWHVFNYNIAYYKLKWINGLGVAI